ncbi:hypothetical protein M5E88_19620 [Akkermansia muciniphila]|nr:hypothetical protein M5E88_19620 [Akkermansia muciniphila]
MKSIFPESRPLLEQYRELGLADISPGTEAHPERPRTPARGRHCSGTVLTDSFSASEISSLRNPMRTEH